MTKGYQWLLDHGDDAIIIILWDYFCEFKEWVVGLFAGGGSEEGDDEVKKSGRGSSASRQRSEEDDGKARNGRRHPCLPAMRAAHRGCAGCGVFLNLKC